MDKIAIMNNILNISNSPIKLVSNSDEFRYVLKNAKLNRLQ